MNLGYDVAQALPGLRAEAESRMTETVTVGKWERIRPPGELDAVLTLVETYYSGKGRVKYQSASVDARSPAGQQLSETKIVLSLPSSSASVPTGARVVVDASTADEALSGLAFTVDGPATSGQTTAHRYPLVEES